MSASLGPGTGMGTSATRTPASSEYRSAFILSVWTPGNRVSIAAGAGWAPKSSCQPGWQAALAGLGFFFQAACFGVSMIGHNLLAR
jgi:hypothetical protein